MGLFSSPSDKYSQVKHYFPTEDFRRIFRSLKIKTLSQTEESLVEEELDKLRSDDGKISLREIYQVLHNFRLANKISIYDEKALLNIFIDYFEKNFK